MMAARSTHPMAAASLADETLDRFRAVLATRLGLVYPEQQVPMLAALLAQRATALRLEPAVYVQQLDVGALQRELPHLAPALTTAETYFFRNIEQFHVLREVVLPALLGQRRAAGRSVSILSAGCASGEELYTVAMIARASGLDLGAGIDSLLGVDLNQQVLERARAGLYSRWSLRETPPDARQRWFTPEGQDFQLHPELRAMAQFEQRNLCAEDPEFWRPGRFDVVFARNVLMYFDPPALRAAVARLTHALAPGGYLFLGHSESLRELAAAFDVCHTHGTFYYRRRDTPPMDAPEDWVAAIGRATERVRGLMAQPAPPAPPAAPLLPMASGHDLVHALSLFSEDRCAAAAAVLDELPADAARATDARLLRAMLHVHDGDLQQAEDLAHTLLMQSPRCAAAHYVIGLCRESGGDLAGAANRHALAARLDTGFALPWLQLGRLARRRSDGPAEREALQRAARLLEGERREHLLLFGGGFDRQALLALCRSAAATP